MSIWLLDKRSAASSGGTRFSRSPLRGIPPRRIPTEPAFCRLRVSGCEQKNADMSLAQINMRCNRRFEPGTRWQEGWERSPSLAILPLIPRAQESQCPQRTHRRDGPGAGAVGRSVTPAECNGQREALPRCPRDKCLCVISTRFFRCLVEDIYYYSTISEDLSGIFLSFV